MKKYLIKPGDNVRLKDYDPDDHRLFHDKEKAKKITEKLLPRLDTLQEKLYAEGRRSVLVVLQGMDTSGKDGVIRHVMRGMNPQSCQVVSFKVPTFEELRHDFLWRIHQKVPPKGYVTIFNRSHYEDVLVTRVHHRVSGHEAKKRFKHINHFERLLTENGTKIVKFFLHISKDEQRERLQARVDDPEKRWKFSAGDISERDKWSTYQRVYEEALSATSTEEAPWYVVPANRKWYRNWVIAEILVGLFEEMKPRYPSPDSDVPFSKLKIR